MGYSVADIGMFYQVLGHDRTPDPGGSQARDPTIQRDETMQFFGSRACNRIAHSVAAPYQMGVL